MREGQSTGGRSVEHSLAQAVLYAAVPDNTLRRRCFGGGRFGPIHRRRNQAVALTAFGWLDRGRGLDVRSFSRRLGIPRRPAGGRTTQLDGSPSRYPMRCKVFSPPADELLHRDAACRLFSQHEWYDHTHAIPMDRPVRLLEEDTRRSSCDGTETH